MPNLVVACRGAPGIPPPSARGLSDVGFRLWAFRFSSCPCGARLDRWVAVDGCRSHRVRWLSSCGLFARFVPYVTTREWCLVCMGRLDPCFGQRHPTVHSSSFLAQEQLSLGRVPGFLCCVPTRRHSFVPSSLVRLVFPFGVRHGMNLEASSVIHATHAVVVAHGALLELSDAERLEGMRSCGLCFARTSVRR